MQTNHYTDIIQKMSLREKAELVTGKNSWRTKDFPQYGIPSLLMSDGTNGIRFQIGSGDVVPGEFKDSLNDSFDTKEAMEKTHVATCYPSGSAMASSWDRDLLYQSGERLASECRSMGIGMLLGPGMNIRRHPLTARNFEYYSEDPVVSGEIAAAIVNGLQDNGIATSIKHFVCHNSDDRRTRVNVTVSERAFREIYLSGFERTVRKAQPATIMTCYNTVNGKAIDADYSVLEEIVRGEWGFEGAFISDWGAIKDIVASTNAGFDLQMPYSAMSTNELVQAVEDGRLEEAALDARAAHVLDLVFKYADQPQETTDQDINHEQAVQAALEGMVLLRNEDNTLPIRSGKVALIGSMFKEPQFVGSGCAIVKANKIDNPYEAITAYAEEHNIEITYAEGFTESDTELDAGRLEEALRIAKEADTVLLYVGTYPPEEGDTFNRSSMELPKVQTDLLKAICDVNPHTAVLLAAGEVIAMPWAENTGAILDTWYGGEGIGSALTQLLFGEVSPSGKLTVTIPKRPEDTPAHLAFTDNPYEIQYGEDLYVGYRYYDRKKIAPAFPFGHGLAYTTFAYTDAHVIEEDDEHIAVACTVANTGTYKAAEIIQVYTEPQNGRAERPVRELKNFARVELEPGESKEVSFTLYQRDFCYFDEINHEWTNDASAWTIRFASSSRDLRLSLACTRPYKKEGFHRLAYTCGYHEIFSNRETRDMLFDWLIEKELLTEELNTEKTEQTLANTFWPVRSHLDMNANGKVNFDEFNSLIDRMNEALEQKYRK